MNNKYLTGKSNETNGSRKTLHRTKSVLFAAGLFASIGFFGSSPANAQKSTWNYVTTITEGVKFYVGKDFKTEPDGRITAWEKLVKPDRSFIISFVEWDCRNKRRRALETTFYNSDDTVVGTRKQIANSQQQRQRQQWTPVMPGSSGELLYARVCLPAPAIQLAEITMPRAALKAAPAASAPVLRVAARGATFRIIAGTGRGGWFNVVDDAESAENDYWLFADDFRTLTAAEMATKKRAKNESPVTAKTKTKAKVKVKAKGKAGNRK